MKSRNIILIGFMGTGKTTVGKLLAARLGWSFVDTDARIESEQGVPVGELFEQRGETAFRQLETDMLERVVQQNQQVIATGGGAVLQEMNRSLMMINGYVVALQADQSTIVSRVSGNSARPLLRGDVVERVSRLMEQRKFAYDFADQCIDTTQISVDQVVTLILDKRKEALD
jgi:shikimate kinase